MTEKLQISIIIPIYNNNDVLIDLNKQLLTELRSFRHEIIYVNDSSPDKSLDTLKILSTQYDQVNYINLLENIGQQKATLKGLKKAIGQKIVVLDGDLQDNPKLIPELYKMISSTTSDAVFVKRKGIYQSKGRMTTSILIKKIVQAMSGLHYKAGSYYMFDRSILEKVVLIGSKCKYPYMSIIVTNFAGHIKYLVADRGKSIGPSGYNFTKRVKAARMAIYCSAYCSYSKSILG